MRHPTLRNKILVFEDHAEIIIPRRRSGKGAVNAIIDLEDIPKVSDIVWSFDGGYAKNTRAGYLAHLLIGAKPDKKRRYAIDHINRNPLDNRKSNLRVVPWSVNIRNTNGRKDNKTGHAGVYLHPQCKRWVAYLRVKGKLHYVGRLATKEDAIRVRGELEEKFKRVQ